MTTSASTPDSSSLEMIIAKAIADAGNVPFVGPKQRKAAAAVIDALKANRRVTILTLREEEL